MTFAQRTKNHTQLNNRMKRLVEIRNQKNGNKQNNQETSRAELAPMLNLGEYETIVLKGQEKLYLLGPLRGNERKDFTPYDSLVKMTGMLEPVRLIAFFFDKYF